MEDTEHHFLLSESVKLALVIAVRAVMNDAVHIQIKVVCVGKEENRQHYRTNTQKFAILCVVAQWYRQRIAPSITTRSLGKEN
jgi:hypothetical protein